MSIASRFNITPLPIPTNTTTCTKPIINKEEREIGQINNIDEVNEHKLCGYEKSSIIARKSAIEMHNKWRETFISQNGNIPRIKKNNAGIDVDINVIGELLDLEFLEFNYNIALFVASYIKFYKLSSIEECASVIHRKWLMMSPWAKNGSLDISYDLLPEIEKQKDRDIYIIVSKYIN